MSESSAIADLSDELILDIIHWIQENWECRISNNLSTPFPVYSLTVTSAQLDKAFGNDEVSGVEFLEAVLMKALDNENFAIPKGVASTKKQKRCLVQGFSRAVVGDNAHSFEVDFNPALASIDVA